MDKKFQKAKKTLEFDKILNMLKQYASSSLTKEYIDSVEISTDISIVQERLLETSEALALIIKKAEPPLFGIKEINKIVKRAKMGGILNPKQFLEISDFLRVSRYLKVYIKKDERDNSIKTPIIDGLIENLYTNKNIEDSINSKIISEDELADDASRTLKNIRSNIIKKQDSIRDRLNSIVNTHRDYLQDSIVTMREGRYVVPVKQGSKSKVRGLVHDISSSGATVYIEPMDVVNANNELKTLFIEEKEEIEKILQNLSEEISKIADLISPNEDILKMLDFYFAKAKLSLSYNGNKPKLNNKKYINLKNAYHPLLDRKIAVPIDIYLGEEFTSLIITGPNTGGKTVSIKTVGLLCLMNQYGLHTPCDESSELGIFNNLFTDIGDEQSIEQSLSTFSSHMVNIVDILKNVDENSLVIFDELGAGTDPTEGAALARAIMECMLDRKIRTISTTHYNQLKIYALTTKGVKNASMEFNVDTLSPTYKLLIGVPGKSNAFEISKRLGLSDNIINNARNMISEDSIEFEKVLASIEEDRTKAIKYRDEMKTRNEELLQKNKKLEIEIKRTNKSRDKIINDAKEEAKKLLLKTREEVDFILQEINQVKDEISSDRARRIQESQDILRDSLKNTSSNKKIVIEKAKNPIKEIKVGDIVRTGLGTEGIILELPDNKGNVLVQSGIMKVKLPKSTLTKIDKEEEKERVKTKNIIKNKAMRVSSEIDLRGKNFEDASQVVDKYIDDAYLGGLKSVRIIHGKGTGILRQKLRDHLRRNKYIKKLEDAAYNEGGDGVTKVTLK